MSNELYEACAPRKHGTDQVDTAELLVTANDSRATLQLAENLGDWCVRKGHDFDRVFAEYQAGRLWPRRRMNDGRLACDYVDALNREAAERGGLFVRETA